MNKNFLLNSDLATRLYDSVSRLPIVDYHNHLSLAEISQNKRFTNVYDLWIKPDPYKHRAMRMCGISERYITGEADEFEKFKAWCTVFPNLVGNPLYIWSLVELENVFGISDIPSENNAEQIYQQANAFLEDNNITVEYLMDMFRVELACPCAGITDDISMFYETEKFSPSLRGDDMLNISTDFITKLEDVTGMQIESLKDFETAVKSRLDKFQIAGLRFADHALDNGFLYFEDDGKNGDRFLAHIEGNCDAEETARLASYILTFLGKEYAKRNIVLQLHIGAQRYTSSKLRKEVGPAGGFAGIGNSVDVRSLVTFLDVLDQGDFGLPKTILFTLNPSDNALFSVLSGSFAKEGVSGLITQGPAWWWCDHEYGIYEVLENSMAYGLLSNFIGMTTDSRSFLSFTRHDYFRRILCNFIADKFEKNKLCCNYEDLEKLVYRLCYENAIGGKKDDVSR